MVSINYATREVCCKIVYYGPGLSGKTTNLQVVHQKVPQNTRGKLISLATEADRTLYFDFLPINIGSINGFAAKFQLYTVPGQVYYNATRRLVLRGVDGVVFVADSQADKHDDNVESLSNLKENLEEYGYDVKELPIVIQYNKTDLPTALSKEELDTKLNMYDWPSYTAAAVDGVGVFDTLKAIMKLVLEKAKKGGTGSSAKPKMTRQAAPVAAPVAAATPEPIMAASQNTETGTGDTQPTAAPEVVPTGKVSTETVSAEPVAATLKPEPVKSSSGGGGLFGAPRSSSGRTRHTAKISSGPVHVTADAAENAPASTGKIDTIAAEQSQLSSSHNEEMVGEAVNSKNIASQDSESNASMIGHDPLEQAPPQTKQKKPGFFRRLFGRK